jgi:hypothetical protein
MKLRKTKKEKLVLNHLEIPPPDPIKELIDGIFGKTQEQKFLDNYFNKKSWI